MPGPTMPCSLSNAFTTFPDPVGFLSTARAIAQPGAPVIVMDERTADVFDPEAGPIEQLLYGFSLTCCLPDSLSHPGSVATGTVMRVLDTRKLCQGRRFRAG